MLISIVTVCLNVENEIEQTLLSIAKQTYNRIDFVVVDGSSTDNTLNIIRRYSSMIGVLKSEKDHGIYDAMNKGLRLARGDAILFLNAGDTLISPYAIELAVEQFEQHPDIDVLYGGIEVRSSNGQTTDFMPPPPQQALEFLILNSLPHQGTLARRRAFGKTGLFNTLYRSHADYDWFLKVATNPAVRMHLAPFLVASFELGGLSSQLERGERERHAIQNKVAFFQTDAWLKRRIELYQDLYIAQRLRIEALESAASSHARP